VCGDSLSVLRNAVLRARMRWNQIVTDTGLEQTLPRSFALYQNYPNPFNIETNIKFDLPETADVTVEIFDVLGKRVKVLVNNEKFDAGTKIVKFRADDLPSGVYFYRVRAGKFSAVNKMVLLK
jgi:hypothetical protein